VKRIFLVKKLFYSALIIISCISVMFINCEKNTPIEKITILQSSVSIGDPHIVSDSANRNGIIYSIYEALVKLDHEGNFQPSLAENWSVVEDSRTWTFNLRSGVKFHNGDMLNADDVVATLGRVLDPAIGGAFGTQGVYISYLGNAKISTIDELKVQIVTEEPMADLLDLVVAMPICPQSELEELPNKYVGSGPYKINEKTETKLVMKAHEDYWGKTPTYKEIHWQTENNPEKSIEALLNGSADLISGLGIKDLEPIKENEQTLVQEYKSGLCIIFMLNAQKGPCRDTRVRQALNYALDIDKIIREIKNGAATPLNGFLTPHHFGYNPETSVYPYDPEKARSLLADAGYKNGLELVFDIPSVMPNEAPQLIQMMAEQFKEVGITIKVVEHKDRAQYSETVRAKNINDACCFDSSPRSTYRVLREKLQSTLKGPWWQGYENKEVNSLIKKAETVFDDAERQKIYQNIYTMITEDAPWIFLYRPTRYFGVRSTLKDWKPRSDGLLIFN